MQCMHDWMWHRLNWGGGGCGGGGGKGHTYLATTPPRAACLKGAPRLMSAVGRSRFEGLAPQTLCACVRWRCSAPIAALGNPTTALIQFSFYKTPFYLSGSFAWVVTTWSGLPALKNGQPLPISHWYSPSFLPNAPHSERRRHTHSRQPLLQGQGAT